MMLDLMGFKKEFVSMCRSTICKAGPDDMEIEERMVNKAQRGLLNGLLFKKEGLECAPTFYVEDFYKEYKAGAPIAELSHDVIEAAERSIDLASLFSRDPLCMFGDPEKLRVRMLSRSRNKEYLKDIPCRELGCGFVYIAEIGRGDYRAVITEGLMKEYGLDKDEFFDIAVKNTSESFPPVLHDLSESVIKGSAECSNLLEDTDAAAPAREDLVLVLTNSSCYWGAGALFYPGVMDRIHELLEGDFYVLPSSVHELIIVKAEDQDPQQLADLVRSANRTVVEEKEILADDLYICESGELHRISYGGVIPSCPDHIC